MARRRPALALALLLLVAACSVPGSGSDDAADESNTSSTAVEFAAGGGSDGEIVVVAPVVDDTPIEPSGDVRIGTLDNGITYYVRSNSAPGGSLSLRLAVNAGSLQQEVPDSGSAHFLEHMLFNGTENYPGNELARALARIGVQFGADLNAYTSFDETVYQLDITALTDDKIDTGFGVLADWASAATIEQEAAVAERGVVREEIRLRDEGPDGVVSTAFNDAYLRGTAYEGREPGGEAELILETDAEQLRAFYDRWYRPELMAVVAVGDLPADRMEDEILDRFGDLSPRGEEPERVEVVPEPIDTVLTDVVVHPELARTFSSIDYSITFWGQETIGGERHTLIQDLYALMINNRLQEAADRGDVELVQPFVTRFNQTRAQSFLGFNFDATDLAAATEFVLSEMQRIELAGFTDDEYQRAASEIATALDQYLAGAPSTQDRALADSYVANFLDGTQISSIADTHARLTGALGEITAAEVTNLFRWELARSAPIVIVVGPDEAALPTVPELDAAVEAAGTATAPESSGEGEVAIESLMAAPNPQSPVATNEIAELGATRWIFENGVTVYFSASDIAANQVDLLAVADGGWSLLPAEDAALAPFAVSAVGRSGLGPHDRLALRRYLATTTASVSPYIEETTEGFIGSSGVEDLEALFQQIHLLVTGPRVDDLALTETIDDGEDQARFVVADAGFATLNAISDVRFDGDQRFLLTPPSFDDLSAERALDIYRTRLGSVDDLVVAVVGDVDEALIGELAATYLGTLPSGPADTWTDVRPDDLGEVVRRDVVAGSGEATGTVAVFFPAALDIDAETRVELFVLEQILSTRLLDVVREELGASYGGQALVEARVAPTEGTEIVLFANVDPGRGDEILEVILAEAADLATNGPTDDELERARSVLTGNFNLIGNAEILQTLLTEDDEAPLTYTRRANLLAAVDRAGLQELAGAVLPTGVRAEVITVPG